MRESRLHYLDSLRGIAAFQVLCSHYCLAYGFPNFSAILTASPLHLWWDGYAAVSFFFVLSGFVLSKGSFDAREAKVKSLSDWGRYVGLRIFRIHPALWFAMALALVLYPLAANTIITYPSPSAWFQSFWVGHLSWRELIINATLLTHHVNDLIPQAWTLSLEFLLSLLVPFAVLLALYSLPIFLACMGLLLFRLELQQFFFHFSLGILIAAISGDSQFKAFFASRFRRVAFFVVGLYLYSSRFAWPIRFPENLAWHMTGVGAALILVVSLESKRIQKILLFSPLRILGEISYSVYLLHFIVLLVVTPRVLAALNSIGFTAGWIPWFGGLSVTALMTLLLAWLSQRYVENPTNSWGKKVIARFRAPRPQVGLT